ncbi:MAG: hypothetical protein KAI47_24120, partial [Deltaproteobacteria bacterium]|nr:hypothetical protein [Deltaproteobacteria bacterium]
LTNGQLERDDVKTAVLANPHRSLVAALLAAGQLAPLQISRHVTSYVMETVLDTFAWRDGNFAFYRHRKLDHESFPTGMELPKLLATGVDTISDPEFNAYFEQFQNRRIFPSPTPPAPIEVFDPDDFTLSIYQNLSRNEALHTLLSQSAAEGDLPRAQRALYLLIECEFADLA